VDTHYPLDAEIILIGRAGRLSMEAGELLMGLVQLLSLLYSC
jgi:hypothetical protein